MDITGRRVETVGRRKSEKTYAVKLTLPQRRYVRGRMEGKTKFQSAIDAGYSVDVARNALQKIERCRAVRVALETWLDDQGLSDRKLQETSENHF